MGIRQWLKDQGIGASPEHYYRTQYRNEMERQLKWFEKKGGRKPTVKELTDVMQNSYSFSTIATLAQLTSKDVQNMAKHLLEV